MSTGAPERVLVNGQPAATISVLDRGLHYGDGLFETIACLHGRPRLLGLHLERLAAGCERLRLPALRRDLVRSDVESLLGGTDAAILKIIVTRGDAVGRGYGASGAEMPNRIALRYAWPPEDSRLQRDGVRVRRASLRLGENAALAGLKHLNRLEQVLARTELPADIWEALQFSSSGRLVSGTMSNVFVVDRDRVLTPRLDRCGVAGVMRSLLLREAQAAGVAVFECDLDCDDLERASEVFLTNARIGIRPVRELDTRILAVGPVTRRLQALLEPLLEKPVEA